MVLSVGNLRSEMGIRGEFGGLCSRVDISDETVERRQKAINEAFVGAMG